MRISKLDYALQFQGFKFLRKLAELVKGDVRKKIEFGEIWSAIDDNISTYPITEAAFKKTLIPILIQDNLVHQNREDELTITYEGIYEVSDHFKISPETFGILTRNDLEKYSQSFLSSLFDMTLNTDSVTIATIKKYYRNRLGEMPIAQIIDSLEQQGLIKVKEIDGDRIISFPEKSTKSPSLR